MKSCPRAAAAAVRFAASGSAAHTFAAFLAAVFAARPASAAFERAPVGPADAASGEIVALSVDPVFGNPAVLGGSGARTEVWGGRPFGMAELRETQCSAWIGTSRWGAGAGVREFGSLEYFERDARLAVSFSPTRPASGRVRAAAPFAVGLASRFLFAGGASFPMRIAFAGDLALRARLDPSTEVGLLLESLAGGAPGDPDRRLARSSLGVARELPARCRGLLEVSRRSDRAPRLAAGLAASPHAAITLRAGARTDPPSLAWGFTARAASFLVSFSSTGTDRLGRTIRVGLAWTPRIAQDATVPADP